MEFEIGKRYKWLNSYEDEDDIKWEDGVLIDIFQIRAISYGKLCTRDNVMWGIPLDADYLEEYKEN